MNRVVKFSVVLLSLAVVCLWGCKDDPKEVPTYTVTVTGGTASPASGETGTLVTLTPDEAPEGKFFKAWNIVSGGIVLSGNTFTIGTANVVIAAVWEDIPPDTYTVTVTGGTASPTMGETGTSVTLTVGVAPEGKMFKEWNVVEGDVTITDNTFTIGEADVVIEAIWEDLPPNVYTVTVTDGSASPESGITGTLVTLTADEAPYGKKFKEWSVVEGGVTITDNTFTIGDADVVIEAVWEDLPVYSVTVTGGTASPESGITGTEVTLTVGVAPEGKEFMEWSVVEGGVTITDNTFTIGTSNVVIEAVWVDIPVQSVKMSKAGWSILGYDATLLENPPWFRTQYVPAGTLFEYMIDDDLTTSWIAQWYGQGGRPPCYVHIDLGEEVVITDVAAHNSDGSNNGQDEYELFVCTEDGVVDPSDPDTWNWVSLGDFDFNRQIAAAIEQKHSLPVHSTARYIKLSIEARHHSTGKDGGIFNCNMSEFSVYIIDN